MSTIFTMYYIVYILQLSEISKRLINWFAYFLRMLISLWWCRWRHQYAIESLTCG